MSGKGTLKNFKTMLAEAKLPERTVEICLRGDLVADHEAAERELEQAKKTQADSLAGSDVGGLVDRIEALEAEMRGHTYEFRLRALPRHEFRALIAEHQPRRDDEGGVLKDDLALGVNRETFFPAIIRRCVADPELDETEWAELLDSRLTDYQYQDLAWTAWGLNAGEVDIPFSLAASRTKRDIAAE